MHNAEPDAEDGITVAGNIATPAADAGASFTEAAQGAVQLEGALAGDEAQQYTPSRQTAWLFQVDAKAQQIELDNVGELASDDENLIWLDLSEYGAEDLRQVADLLHVHRRIVRLASSAWQRPRIDVFEDHFLASVTVAEFDAANRQVEARQLNVIVGRTVVVSAHRQPLPFTEHILARAMQDPDLVRLDTAFLLYIILDELLDYYEQVQERVKGAIQQLQERAIRDAGDDFLEDLLRFKRATFALGQLVEQHRTVFEAFLRADFPYISGDEVQDYFHVLEARLSRLIDALEAAKQEVNGAFDIYVSFQSHRTNQEMKVLTIVATVLLPATLIVGFFGTNFRGVPLNTVPGFAVMVASVVLVSAGLLLLFRRRGWI